MTIRMRDRIIVGGFLSLCLTGGILYAAQHTHSPSIAAGAATAMIAQEQPVEARGGRRMDSAPSSGVLVVQGEGRFSTTADQLEITLSVVTQEPTAEAALDANSAKMEEVVAALKDADLSDEEISTGRFMVQPVMDYGKDAPRITGYQVTNGVTIKTKQTEQVGEIIQAAVAAGVNQVDSLQFTLSNPERARAEAIRRAAQRARGEAEVLAEAAGVSLRRIARINLDSAGSQQPPWPMMARGMEMAMDSGAPAPQIMPGQIETIASVTIEYHFLQRGDVGRSNEQNAESPDDRSRGGVEIEVTPSE